MGYPWEDMVLLAQEEDLVQGEDLLLVQEEDLLLAQEADLLFAQEEDLLLPQEEDLQYCTVLYSIVQYCTVLQNSEDPSGSIRDITAHLVHDKNTSIA